MQHLQFNRSKGQVLKRRGMATVEFALVVPILLSLLMGIIEFGLLVRNNLTLANAAREGARSGSLGAKQDAIRARVTSAAAPLNVTSNGGSITIEQSTPSLVNGKVTYEGVAADLADANAVPVGRLIRVTVVNKHQSLTRFFPFIQDKIMTGSATFRRE